MSDKHVGSHFDDFLRGQNLLAQAEATAVKRVLAFQIDQAMKKKRLGKSTMAEKMGTSRAALDRLLDAENTSVTLQTLAKAAKVVGKKLRVSLT